MADDTRCEIRVEDTGIGIDPEQLPYVFEPFRRATNEGSGFGIGLAVVRSVVQHHGGAVAITSAGVERGTEVVVTLPVKPPR